MKKDRILTCVAAAAAILFLIVMVAPAFAQHSYAGAGVVTEWNRDHTATGVFVAGAVHIPTGSVGDFNLSGLFYHGSFNEGGAKPAVDVRLRYLPQRDYSGVRPFVAAGLTTNRRGQDAQWWPTLGGGLMVRDRIALYGDYLIGDPDGGRPHAWRYGAQGLLPLGRANHFSLVLFGDVTKPAKLPSAYRAGVGIAYEFN